MTRTSVPRSWSVKAVFPNRKFSLFGSEALAKQPPALSSRRPQVPQLEQSRMDFTSKAIFVPSELCDRIIDFLWDTPVALMNCSLTCKLWLPSSHYHMFRSKLVELRRRDDWKLFETLLRGSAEASTGLTNYICNLKIVAFGEYQPVGCTWLTLVGPGTMLHQLLAGLSAVRRLVIDGDNYYYGFEEIAYLQFIHFLCESAFMPSLTTLQLCSIVFETHDDLLRVLSACLPLASLDLKNCYVRHGPLPSVLPMSDISSGSMRRIRLDGDLGIVMNSSTLSSLCEAPLWLLQGSTYELCPRRLTWDGCVTANGQPLLRDLLQRTASSLEHVDLTLRFRDGDQIRDDLVDLSPCHGLVSARFQSDLRLHNARDWVCTALKQICSTRMRELRIGFNMEYNHLKAVVAQGWHWECIDRDLCRLGALNPRMVVYFDYTADFERSDFGQWIANLVADLEGCLPLARKAGLRIAVHAATRVR
ncbi:hypothetical protein B0H21DRAFT_524211 [Amylocystis lapponica]|nr:hypothetical protein B0H21DRAFT_524211 [Amylocystis lapponica]